jgi:hypothetical protein
LRVCCSTFRISHPETPDGNICAAQRDITERNSAEKETPQNYALMDSMHQATVGREMTIDRLKK